MEISEPAILIRINQSYREGMSDLALYEATRGTWKVGKRRDEAEYAFAVYQGMVKEVYKITRWLPALTLPYKTRRLDHDPSRWEFEGEVAEPAVRGNYVSRSVSEYLSPNSRNPIRYVNC